MREVRPFSDAQVDSANRIYADHWYYYFGGKHRWRTSLNENTGREVALYEKPTAVHFLRFVNEVVMTLDEDDEAQPLKKFPEHKSYIEHYVNHVLFNQRFIVVPKSRRLMMTWIHAIYCLWYSLAHPRRNIVWQAQKGDKVADTMENKILHVLLNLPLNRFAPFISQTNPLIPAGWDDRVVNWYKPKRETYGMTRLTLYNWDSLDLATRKLEQGSRILGVPEGENQTRQYTITLFVGDEFAFWKQPRASLKGIRPTLGKNGQGILISSANPGYMEEMIAPPELLPGEANPLSVMPDHIGMKAWYSSSGWFVCWVHYTADDEKRSKEWTEWPDLSSVVKRGDPGYARLGIGRKEWLQEYEIDFSVHTGTSFYPEWSNNLHLMPILNALVDQPLILGFDFGLTPATVICQITASGHLIVVDEFVSDEAGIEQHGELLQSYLDIHYPWWKGKKKRKDLDDPEYLDDFLAEQAKEMVTSYCDPAGFVRSQTDMKYPIEILKKMGFNPVGSVQDIPTRTGAVRNLLTRMVSYPRRDTRLPALLVNQRCKKLVQGFQGGCKQSKTRFRKEKNDFSHVMEALEYVAVMMGKVQDRREDKLGGGRAYKRPFVQL